MKIPSVCDRYRTKLNKRIWEMTGPWEMGFAEMRSVSRVFRKLMDKELAIKDSDRRCLNLHRKWTFAALLSLPKSYTMGSVFMPRIQLTHRPPGSIPITYFVVNGFLPWCWLLGMLSQQLGWFHSYAAIEVLYLWFLRLPWAIVSPIQPWLWVLISQHHKCDMNIST